MKLALTVKDDPNVFRECQLDTHDVFRERIASHVVIAAIRKQIDVFMNDVLPSLSLSEDARFRVRTEYDDFLKVMVDYLAAGKINIASFEGFLDSSIRNLAPDRSPEITDDDYKIIIEVISSMRYQISYLCMSLKSGLDLSAFEVVAVKDLKDGVKGGAKGNKSAVAVSDDSVVDKSVAMIPSRSVNGLGGGCSARFDGFARDFLDMPGKEKILSEVFRYLEFGKLYSIYDLLLISKACGIVVKPSRMKQLFMAAWRRGESVRWEGSQFKIVPQVTQSPVIRRGWGISYSVENSEYKGGGMTLEYVGK